MLLSKSLPTIFAKAMAMSYDLYIIDKQEHIDEWEDYHDRLVTFQQMAVNCDFTTALTAYWGIELSAEQKNILELIYKTTKPWLMGHVFGELMEKLNDTSSSGKDIADIAAILLEHFAKDKESSEAIKKGLLVRFAQIPAGEVKAKKETESEDDN